MCGIAGFTSKNPLPRSVARDLCTALLHYSSSRGAQSAGIYINGTILKRAMHPTDFIQLPAFYNLFKRQSSLALLHTRQPTSGGKGDAQAQPFRVGNTIAVHNGMLWDAKSSAQDYQLKKKSGVDSELIASFSESYGPGLLPEFLHSTFGCSSCAVLNNGDLYLIRDTNPLSYIQFDTADSNSLLIFASTEEILISSISYVWLLTEDHIPTTTLSGCLYKATPSGLERLSDPKAPINTHPYGTTDDIPDWLREERRSNERYREKMKRYHRYGREDFDCEGFCG